MDFNKKFPILGNYFLVKALGTGLNSKYYYFFFNFFQE